MQIEQNRNFIEVDVNEPKKDIYQGKYEKQAMNDTGLDSTSLFKKLSTSFVKDFDPELPLNRNLKNIAEKIRAKKNEGKDVTKFENILVGVSDKVDAEVEDITKQKKSEMIKKYAPFAIGGVILLLLLKK